MKKTIYSLLIFVNIFSFANAQWCNISYRVDPITYAPIVPYDSGTVVPHVVQTFSGKIPIGFKFNFYGTDFSNVVIAYNGYFSFDSSFANQSSTIPTHLPIPWAGYTPNSVFLFFTYFSPSTVRYTTIGISPNRRFIVSYDSVQVQTNVYNTGQVVLYETTNVIEMHILNAVPDDVIYKCFEGIQNSDWTKGVAVPNRNPFTIPTVIQNDGQRFTQINVPYANTTPICMVSVDSATNKNIITWNKPAPTIPMDSFIVYRETFVAGTYIPIGTQAYSNFSTFIDTGSVPAQQANRYKLGFVDSCGLVTGQSAAHKTVHLTISQGAGSTWNLIWDAYEGFGFSTFNIYRGTTLANMTLLTSIASTLYSYTDLTPPAGTVYYMIEVVNPSPCSPSIIGQDNNSLYRTSSNGSSFSNIVNSNFTFVPSVKDESFINIYPNPLTSSSTLQFNTQLKNAVVIIYDMLGHEMMRKTFSGNKMEIEKGNMESGVYFVKVSADERQWVGKIIVE